MKNKSQPASHTIKRRLIGTLAGLSLLGASATVLFSAEATTQDPVEETSVQVATSKHNRWQANTTEEIHTEIQRQLAENVKPPNVSTSESEAHEYYQIQLGDTVWGITNAYRLDFWSFVEMNDINNPDLIYAGDWVRLDVKEATLFSKQPLNQGLVPAQERSTQPVETSSESKTTAINENEVVSSREVETPEVKEPTVVPEVTIVFPDPNEVDVSTPNVPVDVVESDTENDETIVSENDEETPSELPDEDHVNVDDGEVIVDEEVEVVPDTDGLPEDTDAEEVIADEEVIDSIWLKDEENEDEPVEIPVDAEEEETLDSEDVLDATEETMDEDDIEAIENDKHEPVAHTFSTFSVEPFDITAPNLTVRKETVRQGFIINHAVRYVADDTLPIGERKVQQEGINGYRTNILERVYINDQLSNETLVDSEVNPATDEIIAIGTKQEVSLPEISMRKDTIRQSFLIKHAVRYQADDTLPTGERRVIQEGQNGSRVNILERLYINDNLSSEDLIQSDVVEAVDEIIAIGTQTKEVVRRTTHENVPYTTVERQNPNLPKGERRTVQTGQNGTIERIYEVTIINGVEQEPKLIEERVSKEMVQEIIEVGTKEENKGVTLSFDIPYRISSGDTLNSIAREFGTTIEAINQKNPGLIPTQLRSGQELLIPSATARPMDHQQAHDNRHIIYLDAGHGGWESGAVYNNTAEKTLNLTMANKVSSRLKAKGYEVIHLRTNDEYIALLERSRRANNTNADIFVSLHHNAMAGNTTTASGIETFYYRYNTGYPSTINEANHNNGTRITNSAYLSSLIQNNLIKETGAVDRGVKTNTFSVLRETAIPSTLLEFGFMNNPTEYQKLINNNYQNKMAQAVVDAIDSYFINLY